LWYNFYYSFVTTDLNKTSVDMQKKLPTHYDSSYKSTKHVTDNSLDDPYLSVGLFTVKELPFVRECTYLTYW